jgi:hypothetical protein
MLLDLALGSPHTVRVFLMWYADSMALVIPSCGSEMRSIGQDAVAVERAGGWTSVSRQRSRWSLLNPPALGGPEVADRVTTGKGSRVGYPAEGEPQGDLEEG